jgi:hypothetical protein
MIPVRLSGDKEALSGARFALLLESLSRHWTDAAPLKMTVVGRADELGALRRWAGWRSSLELYFLDEREFLRHPGFDALAGWYKQIFLKLLFAEVCTSDAYLYLDADIICVRPIGRENLVCDGKALSDWEPKATHPGWWAASRRMLGGAEAGSEWGLAVTPNVFTRQVACAIPAAVAAATSRDPIEALIAATGFDGVDGWVEQGLYTELGEITGDLARLHTPKSRAVQFHSPADVWDAGQLPSWRPLQALAERPDVRLMVVQSTLKLSPTWLRLRLAPRLYWPSRRP